MLRTVAGALAAAVVLSPLAGSAPSPLAAKVEALRERVIVVERELATEREIRETRDYQLARCFVRTPSSKRIACFRTFIRWYAPERLPDVP